MEKHGQYQRYDHILHMVQMRRPAAHYRIIRSIPILVKIVGTMFREQRKRVLEFNSA